MGGFVVISSFASHSDPGIITPPTGSVTLYHYSGDDQFYIKFHDTTHAAVGGGGGGGDFLADGSVPMTGALQLGNQAILNSFSLQLAYNAGANFGQLLIDSDGRLVFSSDDAPTEILDPLIRYFESKGISLTIPALSTDTIDWTTPAAAIDVGGLWSSGTPDVFTAPIDGIYRFDLSILVTLDAALTAGAASTYIKITTNVSSNQSAWEIFPDPSNVLVNYSVVLAVEFWLAALTTITVEIRNTDLANDMDISVIAASVRLVRECSLS